MWVLIAFLLVAIVTLISNISYKNHCIEDLEISKARLKDRKDAEIMEILYQIQEYTDFSKTYSKEVIRDYVNKKIELNTATNDNV